ncbi:uncharacterized protein LOC119730658 [Patiria miniata]|uniref:DUF7630 domain-containing protein n=1 Tax=Patiria miniata TaxID=46514 RepID=A0A914A822_PATMI|nr:uncharacterized protein LOC119730658 [Patiria miniata]
MEILSSLACRYASGNQLRDIDLVMKNGVKLLAADFEDNRIRAISKNTFARCTKLMHLYLNSNDLTSIGADAFKSCTNLQHLSLERNKISTISAKELTGPKFIETLKISGNHLKELGPDTFEGLQIQELWIRSNDLQLLRAHTFGIVPKLSWITLDVNRIPEIPTSLFVDPSNKQHRKEIQTFSFAGNAVSRVVIGAFNGVKKFNKLEMQSNHLTTLPEGLFEPTTEIMELFLADNDIVFLPENLLVNATLTDMLDISSNRLPSIPDGLFRNQTKLRRLFIQRNQIRVLNREMFKDLDSLEFLMHKKGPIIYKIHCLQATKLQFLLYFYRFAFDNPVTEIQDWLFYNTQLTNLYMFQNNLSSIGKRPFATVNNTIKQVSLYNSHLTTISDVVWQDLGSNAYVAVDNTIQFAPATNRTDLKIELVGDGFALPIRVSKTMAGLFNDSGFTCSKTGFKVLPWRCVPCAQGYYGDPQNSVCKACPPGGFYQIKTGQVADKSQPINCKKCNNGTYVTPAAHPGISPADCTVCPTGTNKSLHAGFRACSCLDKYYRKDRFGECYRCPDEGLNCSGEYQHLLPGFWWTWNWGSNDNYKAYRRFVVNMSSRNDSYNSSTQHFRGVLPKVHPCPRKESCLNEGDGINVTCEVGYEGWLCSECSVGYYAWFDSCHVCPKWWWFLLEVVLLLVVLAVVILVIAWDVRRNQRKGRSAIDVIFARGKILLGFYQVMGEIFSALNEIPWPNILTKFGSFLRLLEMNIVQLVISPRCYFPDFTYRNVYIEYLFGMSLVAFVVLAALCFYWVSKCYFAVKKCTVEERVKVLSTTRQKCYLFVVMLLFVSYPGLSGVIFTLLPSGCDLFYLDENETYNATRLRSDYSIDCQDEQHVHFNHAAEVSLCYVVGFPSLLFVFLWRSNRQDKRKNSEEQPLLESAVDDPSYCSINDPTLPPRNEDDSSLNQSGINLLNPIQQSQADISWKSFLSGNYKAEFWYWEIVELSRKIIQTLFVLLYGPDDHFTMFATIAISVGFLLLHAYVRPMKDATDNRLQMCSLATIFLNLLAASLLLSPAGGGTERTEVLAAILVLMNFSIIVFVIGTHLLNQSS